MMVPQAVYFLRKPKWTCIAGNSGESTKRNELLNWLSGNESPVPDILFLDLNLPLNNGYACLAKIRLMEKLKDLPIVIYSNSFDPITADALHGSGIHYYIRKPLDFMVLKKLIRETIFQITAGDKTQPPVEHFVRHRV